MIDRDFEQVSEEHMKSMTKPEGPAQESSMKIDDYVHPENDLCAETGCAPATPAPSQPAGAREFIESRQFALEAFMHWLAGQCEAYARQQAAAKDTEIAWLRKERQRHLVELEAAERERDSLREVLVETERQLKNQILLDSLDSND